MKRTMKMVVLSSLVFAVQGAVAAGVEQPYPADAEASYDLPALDTYADQQARAGTAWGANARSESVFPADGEAVAAMPGVGSYAAQQSAQPSGASEMRSQSAIPFTVQIADG